MSSDSHFFACPLCGKEYHRALIASHCSRCDGTETKTKTTTTTTTETKITKISTRIIPTAPPKPTPNPYGPLRPVTSADLGPKRKRGLDRPLQEFSHLVVLDFEWTCDNKLRQLQPRPPAEIIEFSCVLVKTCPRPATIVAEFQQYCRPELHPVLSTFCKELTGITQDQINKGVPLEIAIAKFHHWLQCHDIILNRQHASSSQLPFAICTWSDADLGGTLPRQMEALKLTRTPWFDRWINLKLAYTSVYKKDSRGLQKCVEKIGLHFEGRAHSGLVDSINTAKIVLDMINKQNYRFCRCTRYLEKDSWAMVGTTKMMPQKKNRNNKRLKT